MTTKRCGGCSRDLPISSFRKRGDGMGIKSTCVECDRAYGRLWWKRNGKRVTEQRQSPEFKQKQRKMALKRNYGIPYEQYERLLSAQDGKCAVCCRSDEPLSVDHCHKTRFVRGLLCNRCNLALGLMKDSAAAILAMARYVADYDPDIFWDEWSSMLGRLTEGSSVVRREN